MLAPHLHEGAPLTQLAAAQDEGGVSNRTLRRWLADYRQGGLDALMRPGRRDKGLRRFPDELVAFIEGLALRKPRPSAAVIHRQAESIAKARGWSLPAYRTAARIVADLDPALVTLGLEAQKIPGETYDLVYRREAKAPNEIWQADHTELDIRVLDDKGELARPWLTAIEDDHSRAIAGYAVNTETPSALTTALAFRHAIWQAVARPQGLGGRGNGLDARAVVSGPAKHSPDPAVNDSWPSSSPRTTASTRHDRVRTAAGDYRLGVPW